MLIKESFVKQKPVSTVLKENGDAMEYYMNHPEEHWDRLIEKFEGSRVKFEHWCHKAYLGPRGPKVADQSKYDKAMAHFDKKTPLSEGLLSLSKKSQLSKQEWLNKQKKSTEYKETMDKKWKEFLDKIPRLKTPVKFVDEKGWEFVTDKLKDKEEWLVIGRDQSGNVLLKNTHTKAEIFLDEDLGEIDSLLESMNLVNEAFQYEDILNMKYDTLLAMSGGNTMQTLRDLNAFMSSVQGTEDTKERKAYFKAKGFYEKLVRDVNEVVPNRLKEKIAKKIKKMEKKK